MPQLTTWIGIIPVALAAAIGVAGVQEGQKTARTAELSISASDISDIRRVNLDGQRLAIPLQRATRPDRYHLTFDDGRVEHRIVVDILAGTRTHVFVGPNGFRVSPASALLFEGVARSRHPELAVRVID